MSAIHHQHTWLKKILIITLCLFVATTFTGCRKKCEEGSSTWPECDVSAVEAPTNYRKLVFWNLHDPQDVFRGQIQQFQSAAEKGLTIEYHTFNNVREYEELLLSEMAQGKGPDIFAIDPVWLTSHPGLMTPMPEDILVVDQFKLAFFPVAAETLIREDKIYALPMYIDTLGLYYNAKIFRNQLYKTNKPGETWEQVKTQSYDMRDEDKSVERFRLSPIAMGRADNIRTAHDIISMLLLQHDADLFDTDRKKAIIAEAQGTMEGTGKPKFPGIEAIGLYAGFADTRNKNYSWNRLITGLYPDLNEIGAFARGKTAMIFGYSSTYNDIIAAIEGLKKNTVETITPEDIATAPAPQLAGFNSTNKKALAHFYPLTVSAISQNPHEAWQFVNYVATDVNSVRDYHNKTKKPSAMKELNTEQVAEANFGVFARQIEFSYILDVIDEKDYIQILKNAITELDRGQIEDVIQLVQIRLQCVLDKTYGQQLDNNCPQIQ